MFANATTFELIILIAGILLCLPMVVKIFILWGDFLRWFFYPGD